MKLLLIITINILLFTTSCSTQVQTFFVKPVQTDVKYSALQERHYIVRNNTLHKNKLVLFLGGTGSKPKNYEIFCEYAASLGFDVISLSYSNKVAAMTVAANADSLAFDKYRQDICFGTPLSDIVSVDTLNSIYTRTLKLIQYLSKAYPDQNWRQYLKDKHIIDWSKIIVAGHSQGSGHACYLAKKFKADRVLMFSGPNDFSTYYNRSAAWLKQTGATPVTKYFALEHLRDEVVAFKLQYSNLKTLGMIAISDTALVDNSHPPYKKSHCLYINIPALLFHNSTVGDNAIVYKAWEYMLTSE